MIEIVQTTGRQPWHVRLRAEGNHEPTLWSENYAEERGAVEAVELLGATFSPLHRAEYVAGQGYVTVWLDADDDHDTLAVPVHVVDERQAEDAPKKPTRKRAAKKAAAAPGADTEGGA